MDLGTMKTKLEDGLYLTAEDFKSDMLLVIKNCRDYNKSGHILTGVDRLENIFQTRWLKLSVSDLARFKSGGESKDAGTGLHESTEIINLRTYVSAKKWISGCEPLSELSVEELKAEVAKCDGHILRLQKTRNEMKKIVQSKKALSKYNEELQTSPDSLQAERCVNMEPITNERLQLLQETRLYSRLSRRRNLLNA